VALTSQTPARAHALHVDVFCRVVDNFGDVGVCWRAARAWAARGHTVRLWIDDATVLGWMASATPAPINLGVRAFAQAHSGSGVGDVVIEAFGCNPPDAFLMAMRQRRVPPVWINLEYLSAEAFVERNHGLPSPALTGPAKGLDKWFYYPGFTAATGGLLASENRLTWTPPATQTNERLVSLFTYETAPLCKLLDALNAEPTCVVVAQGPSMQALTALRQREPYRWPLLRWHVLPWLDQRAFDDVLWQCDLNVVRGEDSLTIALQSGKPTIWQAYPQTDQAHQAKVDALLARMQAPTSLKTVWRSLNDAWPMHEGGTRGGAWPPITSEVVNRAWAPACQRFASVLATRPSLADALVTFARSKGARIEGFAAHGLSNP
jgi:uncharacterized repeat protein (TIGR03837 family)